ncbi:MAG TPA: thioredoxin family protein [Anaerolineales bacterium]|nr:thioredoxin family protein [Anaerolineales bacterium]
MRIEILGTGCYKCVRLESLIHEVTREAGRTDVEIIRVDHESAIRKFMPLDEIPGLVIDGHLVGTGRVPDRATLVEWLGVKSEA